MQTSISFSRRRAAHIVRLLLLSLLLLSPVSRVLAGWTDWQTVWRGTEGQHVDWSYAIGAYKYEHGAREYDFRWRLYGFDKPMRVKYRYTEVTDGQMTFEDGEVTLKPNGEIHREMGDECICNQVGILVGNQLLPADAPDNSPPSANPRQLLGVNSTIADDGSTPSAKSPAARLPVIFVQNGNRFTIPGGYCPPAAANPGVNNTRPMLATGPAPGQSRSTPAPTGTANRTNVGTSPIQNNAPTRYGAPVMASGGSTAPVRRNNPPPANSNPQPVQPTMVRSIPAQRSQPVAVNNPAPAPTYNNNNNASVNAHNERVQEQLNNITQRIQSNNATSANINSQLEALKTTIMEDVSSSSDE